ncbi:hypothetical protein [Micromonospora zamorensis]|uniref:hypothetical protein n=1 Tax=Micromonospora zamorensis TaxID=709883 RepID=UPI003CF6E9A4
MARRASSGCTPVSWTGSRYLPTHPISLEEGAHGYELFEKKQDGCLRSVLHP